MNMYMENLEITFTLASPVLLTYPWLSLDGYLAYVTAEETLGDRAPALLQAREASKAWDDLPVPVERLHFTREDGTADHVYHASIGRFEHAGATGSKTLFKMFCSEGADRNVSRKEKYMIVGGQFKLRSIQHPLNHSRHVTFWVRGIRDAIERQVAAIHALGKRTASGNGRVASVAVRVIEVDWSLIHPEHGVNRPVPVPVATRANMVEPVATLAYKPPYWAKENHVPCIIPGGFA